jgi:tetratricopeptide (TPR) repeat protein
MNKLKTPVFAAILLVFYSWSFLFAETSASVKPQNALVMVNMRSVMGRRAGNGFVTGDGTLVVTAHHLVFEESKQGRHEMAGLVSVISPYLGDGCEAEIIAANDKLDLAILKIPWKGHPALRLADESGLLSIERVVVIGMPEIIRSLGTGSYKSLPEHFGLHRENLAVDSVVISRQQIPWFISLSEIGQLGHGWSGSPMLLPDSTIVAGCFTTLHTATREGRERISAIGPAVTQVRHLLEQSRWEKSLIPSNSTISQPKDGADAFILYAQAYRHLMNEQYELVSDSIEKFIDLRPESYLGYTLSAINAEKNKKFDIAEQYYQKALKLNPEGTALKVLYAQFLSEHQPDRALELCQDIWKYDKFKPYIALAMFNILSERGEYQRCAELLSEAVKVNPENAYLWLNLGGCHFYLGKQDDAVANITKAVELLPERGPFRGQLARLLENIGKLDEAEKHFRELLNIEPDNPVVHFWLAEFLAKHRPQAKDEALKEAQTALELPPKKSLPKQKIEQLIQELQSKITPAP